MKYLFLLFLSITLVCSLAFADYRTPDRVIPIYKTPAAPVIDGEVDSLWTDVQAYGVTLPDPNGKESELTSTDDYAGYVKIMWDDDKIYVLVTVADNILVTDEAGEKEDKVELMFDADGSDGVTKEEYNELFAAEYGAAQDWWWTMHPDQKYVYDENSSQWVLTIDSESILESTQGPGLAWGQHRFPVEGIETASLINDDDMGYNMEFAFPWESLNGFTPINGDTVGFGIHINDFDEPGSDDFRGFYNLIMDYSNSHWCDPSVMADLVVSTDAPGTVCNAMAAKAASTPVIDGEMDEIWRYTMPHQVVIGDPTTEYWPLENSMDFLCNFRVLWDDENVYLYYTVIDDILISDDTNDDDRIEMFFEPDVSGGITKEEYDQYFADEYGASQSWWWSQHPDQIYIYDEDCSQWTLNLDGDAVRDGTQGPGLHWGKNLFPTEGIEGAILVAEDEIGYAMEFKFPWTSLNAFTQMKAGNEVGFNAQPNDWDEEGKEFRSFYNWRMVWPNASWCDPNNFGHLILSELMIDLGGTSVPSLTGKAVESMKLNQNYPNPFNPATTIDYSVASKGHVTLEVFNLLGEKIATLIDGNFEAGSYTIDFDATNLNSGIYFYKLTSNTQVLTLKMTLIK